MPFQTTSLVMTGLGVIAEPNNAIRRLDPAPPPLKPGVHLRWAFNPSMGFPRGGFYLFRRAHRAGVTSISVKPEQSAPETLPHDYTLVWLASGAVLVRSDQKIAIEQPGGPGHPTGFSLAGRTSVKFDIFPRSLVSCKVVVRVRDIAESDFDIAVYTENYAVLTAGGVRSGPFVDATAEFDLITGVEIRPRNSARFAGGCVLEVLFFDVQSSINPSDQSWTSLNSEPIRLPVTHPTYHCTAGRAEDVDAERTRAHSLIAYGDPKAALPAARSITADGKVIVSAASPLVLGQKTEWQESYAGTLLRIAGEGSVYVVSAVLGPTKLLLSRPYEGPNAGTPQDYSLTRDSYGEIYDHCVNLVRGGAPAGAMSDRSVPSPIPASGTISVLPGQDTADGAGVTWGPEIEGAELMLVVAQSGTISLNHGSTYVDGDSAAKAEWKAGQLAGAELLVDGRPSAYFIKTYRSDLDRLELDRAYEGPTRSKRPYTAIEPAIYRIENVISTTRLKLSRAYEGATPAQRAFKLTVRLRSSEAEPVNAPPVMPQQKPLDLVLLYAMHPAFAQMLGLYWVDDTIPLDGSVYDYVLLADYQESFRNAAEALDAFKVNPAAQTGFILFKKGADPSSYFPLEPPRNVRVFDLPGTSVTPSDRKKVSDCNAGLTWGLAEPGIGALLPNRAMMYHAWRASLGESDPATGDLPPNDSAFKLLTEGHPVLAFNSIVPQTLLPPRPPRWPRLPMQLIDRALPEGWHCYQVHGIDVFGRHSAPSASAAWWQWTPVPSPKPWYYDDGVKDGVVRLPNAAQAVHVLDQVAPSPPTAIEASALVADDPLLVKDAAYDAWRKTLSAEERAKAGLRVRWTWTAGQMLQSPDTREFRIYFQSGHLNSIKGRITSVTPGKTESVVETDAAVPPASPANAYAGGFLQISGLPYLILSSRAGTPLRVTVKNFGVDYNTGGVIVGAGSPVVRGTSDVDWSPAMAGSRIRIINGTETTEYSILSVTKKDELNLSTRFAGTPGAGALSYLIYEFPPAAGARCVVSVPADHADGLASTQFGSTTINGNSANWKSHLAGRPFQISGDPFSYRVVSVNEAAQQITLDAPYAGPTEDKVPYTIRNTAQFIDYTSGANWQERYYAIDYDDHRYFKEAADGAGKTYRRYEILIPPAGDADRTWLPLNPSLEDTIVYANVGVAAADDKAHARDDSKWDGSRWGKRTGNESAVGTPARIFRVLRVPPPAPAMTATEPDVFATPADYHNRSFYTFRWFPRPHLRTHIMRALDETLFQTDWQAKTSGKFSRDVKVSDPFFPPDFTLEQKQAVITELLALYAARNATEAIQKYRTLDNNALHVLAGLPGNEAAFTQITTIPLSSVDYPDRIGPDDRRDYRPDPSLCSYTDKLDGGSTNRFFYRALLVDEANNRGALSLSSPPVHLPNVVPPRVPLLVSVLATDNRQITLRWYANSETDLARYHIHRTDDPESARDVRLMAEVHSHTPTAGAGVESWEDGGVDGATTYYYRVSAEDGAGNISEACASAPARAYDVLPPDPPAWDASAWRTDGRGIDLKWKATPGRRFQTRVFRKSTAGNWGPLTGWLDSNEYTDWQADPAIRATYRLGVRNEAGALNVKYNAVEVAPRP